MRLPISLLFVSVTIAVLSVSVAVLPQQPKAGTASNGSHTLTATARDAAGNQTTSAGVVVTVSNANPAGGIAAL